MFRPVKKGPYEPTKLCKLMRAIGYPGDLEGVCHGIGLTGIQACVTGYIKEYNERLDFIYHYPDLLTVIQEYQKDPKKKIEESPELARRIIDVLAFFDNIQSYQNPEIFHAISPLKGQGTLRQFDADSETIT